MHLSNGNCTNTQYDKIIVRYLPISLFQNLLMFQRAIQFKLYGAKILLSYVETMSVIRTCLEYNIAHHF